MGKRVTSHKPRKTAAKQSDKRRGAQKVGATPAEPPAYTVFISHSSKEKWIADQVSKEIMALGAETWLDLKDLRGGDEIRRSVKRGIRASQEVVVLLSADSITSQWVIYEAGVADGQGKRITPILNSLGPDETLAPLQGVKAIDLNDFGEFLVELAERIKRRLGKTRKAVV